MGNSCVWDRKVLNFEMGLYAQFGEGTKGDINMFNLEMELNAQFRERTKGDIPYLGLYNAHWCIMRTPSWP